MLGAGYPTMFIKQKLAPLGLDEEQHKKLKSVIWPICLRFMTGPKRLEILNLLSGFLGLEISTVECFVNLILKPSKK